MGRFHRHHCFTWAAVVIVFGSSMSMRVRAEEPGPFAHDNEELSRFVERQQRDLRRIRALDINQFHRALVHRMMLRLPRDLGLRLQYDGIIASDSGSQTGMRLHGSLGNPLTWTVFDKDGKGTGVFSVSISACKSEDTLVTFRHDDTPLYVQVTFVDGYPVTIMDGYAVVEDEALNKPLDPLGGRSVRQVVKLLERPSDGERP